MVLVGLTLVLSLLLSVLPGCGGGAAVTPVKTSPGVQLPGTTPTATAPGATTPAKTTVAPPPAAAGEVVTWRWQTGTVAGSPTFWTFPKFADDVKLASGGRLVLEVYPSGAIIPSTELFDAAMTGAVEMGGPLSLSNWSTRDMRFELAGMIAGSFPPLQHAVWRFYETEEGWGPGMTLYNNLADKFGIVILPMNCGIRAPEAEFVATKPLLKPADFEGLTFRGTGWSAKTVGVFGAKGVFVPGSDVYSALQTGVIDACELGTVYSNYRQGYYDICKYTGFPGIHKLAEASDGLVNKDAYEALGSDLQHVLQMCARAHMIRYGTYDIAESAQLMWSGELGDKGITIIYESPEMQETWRSASWGLAEEEAAKNPDFKDWWEIEKQWHYMLDAYVDLQTPQYGPEYPGVKESFPGLQIAE
jgi:TRAP-type mannitol/chloroaromatic compound transport system substrate-binding protein